MKTLQPKEAIAYGWKTTTSNFLFFVGIMAILFIGGSLVPRMLGGSFGHDYHTSAAGLGLIGGIIGALISAYIRLGVMKISLKAVDKKELKYDDVWSINTIFWPYLIASILFGVSVALGSILLIVPGIMIAIAWMFYTYLIIDKGLQPVEALKKSAEITKGYRWQLFGFMIVLVLINIAGAIVLGIGLLWTVPTTMIALAHMYRQLV
ncbi:MAG: DUF975 family protein [Candidatus Andersenbacteria bacterium]|nr:DUF975 family protein [Candidatus Andersenbacteria bacterium]